ncbi:hypothetical protein GCM10010277_78910 [Streptomyces longisporoflavus]|uniref:hypothetical protein n=1 Tax=Streptomyces longisporoflavus TaxID=28044 RepID=UPI00167D8C2F|nr:hypothetical protein [Streptomyces longisporoflavus]GGV69011.1 hypothetical protein GCM10010277_78910 [Streptomyces longisporoflavus]
MYPSDISQFNGIDFTSPFTEAEGEVVLRVPEDVVKHAFAGLIGESYVPKDWGGERSDLYTSRVFVRGRQVSAAWLFKGPGHPRAMDVKALGKNGTKSIDCSPSPRSYSFCSTVIRSSRAWLA